MEHDYHITWEKYAESWKVATESEKIDLFEESLTQDCTYTDPIKQAKSWHELAAYMLECHAQVPGGHFVRRAFSTHHNRSLAL